MMRNSWWTLLRAIANQDNSFSERSATPHSSTGKGDKSPAPDNRSSLRSISRHPSDRCKSPFEIVEPGNNGGAVTLSTPENRESLRKRARARAHTPGTGCAIFENQCREVNDPQNISPQTGNGIPRGDGKMNGHGSTNEVLALRTISFSLSFRCMSCRLISFCPLFHPPLHPICALDI